MTVVSWNSNIADGVTRYVLFLKDMNSIVSRLITLYPDSA